MLQTHSYDISINLLLNITWPHKFQRYSHNWEDWFEVDHHYLCINFFTSSQSLYNEATTPRFLAKEHGKTWPSRRPSPDSFLFKLSISSQEVDDFLQVQGRITSARIDVRWFWNWHWKPMLMFTDVLIHWLPYSCCYQTGHVAVLSVTKQRNVAVS